MLVFALGHAAVHAVVVVVKGRREGGSRVRHAVGQDKVEDPLRDLYPGADISSEAVTVSS